MSLPEADNDYPLSEVPASARKPYGSLALLLLGFTFFTATMFAGGQLGSLARPARLRSAATA